MIFVLLGVLAQSQAAATPLLFVSNEGSHDISIVDPARGRVIGRVPVGQRRSIWASDPPGGSLWPILTDVLARGEGGGRPEFQCGRGV